MSRLIMLAIPAALVVCSLLLVMFPPAAYPHGGGLDGYGCHHNRKQGGYHCHRGPLAGEVFKIETTGTEYCGDFDFNKFNAGNNLDLWVRLDSDTQLTVSTTPTFNAGTTFPMAGFVYQTGATSAAFVAGVLFVDGSYATIRGTAKFKRTTGQVTKLSGTFIQSEVFFLGCFSSGTFTSRVP